ncbi:MAG: type II toxin-antitoxin system prevent-host-death family antitoxin [Bryobacteraceae bacterium]
MKVTISDFRKNLFKLVDQALDGEDVEVVHRGRTIRLVSEIRGSKLDRLTPAEIFNPDLSEEEQARASRELFAEIEREWEKDWAEL